MRASSIALAVLLVPALASAQVPPGLTYQGRLLNADGTPATGTVTMGFALFDTQAATAAVWSEQQSVALVDGFYSLTLGTETPLSEVQFTGTERWLEITVNGNTLSPRARIESIPYALMSIRARDLKGGTVDATSISVGGNQIVDSTGKLTAAAYSVGSGLQSTGGVLSLPGNCTKNQVLQWNGTAWACASAVGAGTVTNVTGTSPIVVGNGSSTPAVSLINTCGTNQVLKWSGTAWACADDANSGGTVTAVTAGAPLSSSGGRAPKLTLAQASATTAGYLSAADWAAFNAKAGTPSGGIIMYSGAWSFDATGLGTGALTGWALCNGNNGTPNLGGRFVAAATTSADVGTTGGANAVTLTQSELPAHIHSLTVNAVGDHTHGVPIPWTGAPVVNTVSYAGNVSGSSLGAMLTEPGGGHTHTGSIGSTGSGKSFDNRPAFNTLAFIMKL
jgi:microcystin-dependent protein